MNKKTNSTHTLKLGDIFSQTAYLSAFSLKSPKIVTGYFNFKMRPTIWEKKGLEAKANSSVQITFVLFKEPVDPS